MGAVLREDSVQNVIAPIASFWRDATIVRTVVHLQRYCIIHSIFIIHWSGGIKTSTSRVILICPKPV